MTEEKKSLTEIVANLREVFKEANDEYAKMADECDNEIKIAVVKWAMKHIVEHAKEGGSYRYLIYDRSCIISIFC